MIRLKFPGYFGVSFLAFFLAFAFVVFSACKKNNDSIGASEVPDAELLGAVFTDTCTIETHTTLQDSLVTSLSFLPTGYVMLGATKDKAFGHASTSLVLNFEPKNNYSTAGFGTTAKLDSVVLYLRISKEYYGNKLDAVNFSVFELLEDLNKDSIYKSNTTVEQGSVNLTWSGNPISVYPDFEKGFTEADQKFNACIRLRLSNELGNRLVESTNAVTSLSNFRKALKGLKIQAEVNGNIVDFGGWMALVNTADAQNMLRVYYHKDESASLKFLDFPSASNSLKFTQLNHDYSLADDSLKQQLLNPTEKQLSSVVNFVQGGAGVVTRMSLPYINDLQKNGIIAINKAELKVNVFASPYLNHTYFSNPPVLEVLWFDQKGQQLTMPEVSMAKNGEYDQTTGYYTFRLPTTVQRILQNSSEKFYFEISVVNPFVNPYRVILSGPKHPLRPMKLNVWYTTFH